MRNTSVVYAKIHVPGQYTDLILMVEARNVARILKGTVFKMSRN